METVNVLHKKKQLTPKLRFKGFSDNWKKGTIGDYYENLRTGMTPSRTRPDYFKGNIPWISSGELNYGYIETTTESITKEAVENTNLKIYPPDTLFIAITGLEAPGTRGKCAMNKVPAATNQSCLAFEEIPNVSTLFLFQWYKKNGIWLYYNFAQGTKQQSFNNKLVKGFVFNIPSLPEQQKIASFLSALDEKIQQLNRKKELLEQYKKGVMQQLFSGKLRFKDENGKAYPKWEEKRLGDVLDYIQPTKYLVESTEYDDSYETPVLTAGKTFILGYTNETKNIFNDNLPVILFDDFTTATQFVDFPFKAKSSAMKILVPKKNENIRFIYAVMQLIKFEVGGHGRHWISQYALMNISYPCLEEQKKIADFLSAIDVKIDSLSKQINQTQNFKKGLLQQMFV
jgi:type I restriction enzyme S subunit